MKVNATFRAAKPRPAINVPYVIALALVGEERLREHYAQKRSNWKSRGVPWSVVGPILVEQLRSQQPIDLEAIAGARRSLEELLKHLDRLLAIGQNTTRHDTYLQELSRDGKALARAESEPIEPASPEAYRHTLREVAGVAAGYRPDAEKPFTQWRIEWLADDVHRFNRLVDTIPLDPSWFEFAPDAVRLRVVKP